MVFLDDAASLLFRLKMEGLNVREETEKICDVFKQHAFKHVSLFDDAHLLLTASPERDLYDQMILSLNNFIK